MFILTAPHITYVLGLGWQLVPESKDDDTNALKAEQKKCKEDEGGLLKLPAFTKWI